MSGETGALYGSTFSMNDGRRTIISRSHYTTVSTGWYDKGKTVDLEIIGKFGPRFDDDECNICTARMTIDEAEELRDMLSELVDDKKRVYDARRKKK